jgi:hypothetical protein
MTRATATCAAAGSAAECPAGSRCWQLNVESHPSICWPDCGSITCAGTCDEDNSCAYTAETNCDTSCGSYCRPTQGTPGQPGSACTCDNQCQGTATNPGACIYGICMNRASAACSSAGSTAECAAHSRCWGYSGAGLNLCWPDCDTYTCAGQCDADGSCTPTSSTDCDSTCGTLCNTSSSTEECSPANPGGTCPTGSTCTAGVCTMADGCPDWRCQSNCRQLLPMPGSYSPTSAEALQKGYYISTEQRYAYLRKDLTLLIPYAACKMLKKFPTAKPIAIGDMSQQDGLTPGVDVNSPRHPTSTHTGNDVDLSYYQTDGTNNPQIICGDGSDNNWNGQVGRYNDGYFCTTQQNIVDWPKQLWWFAQLCVTPLVRVFGIDETLADDFQNGTAALFSQGEITAEVRDRMLSLGYGNAGGWAFHHHHTHNSFLAPSAFPPLPTPSSGEDCRLHMVCPGL